ncbi:MAG TPA: DUF2069 domain-containing protein [Usitatibacter sp.]|nr:DUF2069 domain-containing protein [Usitatibacter sp.]
MVPVKSAAWLAAVACLVALALLCAAWELFLAPVKPGGSWLAAKALPLLAPLPGVLRARRYTFQWSTLLIWAYFAEGVTRAMSDRGPSVPLAALEIALALGYFVSAVAFLRERGDGA